jgi:hypothetical protein
MENDRLLRRAELLKRKNLCIIKIEEERICTLCGKLTSLALVKDNNREYYCSGCIYIRANNII